MKYPYTLEKYSGRSSRYICPKCKRNGVFVRYVDAVTGVHLSPDVGRCNREVQCGYHYTPKQYFADHPTLERPVFQPLATPLIDEHFDTIDPACVSEFRSNRNEFFISQWRLFAGQPFFQQRTINAAAAYRLGALSNGDAIFWQIDRNRAVRTGKCMGYNPVTGRRTRSVNWMHARFKREARLPAEFKLQQCFFGEHLLAEHPEKLVAIVEAYSTAVCMAAVFDEYVWLAADCLQGLTVRKARALAGRTVILFPDMDGYELWERRATEIRREVNCCINISNYLWDRRDFLPASADLRDVVMRYISKGLPLENFRHHLLNDS